MGEAVLAGMASEVAPKEVGDGALGVSWRRGAGGEAVAVKREGRSSLVLRSESKATVEETFDLRGGSSYTSILPAMMVVFQSHDRLINVIDQPPAMSGDSIEIALHEWPLRDAMLNFGLRVLGLSVVLSLIVAGLIFAALNRVLVRPMRKLSANMMLFTQAPEDASRIISP